jgi:hypothetical protein
VRGTACVATDPAVDIRVTGTGPWKKPGPRDFCCSTIGGRSNETGRSSELCRSREKGRSTDSQGTGTGPWTKPWP